MIRFKNFENFNGEKKVYHAARKAHLLTGIEDFRKAWHPPDNTINFLRWSRKLHYIGK